MQGTIDQVFDAFRNHLKGKRKQIDCFDTYAFQAEGWLKGELVFALHKIKEEGTILDFYREFTALGRKKIDLAVDLSDGRHWIELKHWLIGKQKDQEWGPNAYVSDLENEITKLKAVKAGHNGWIAVLCTRKPNVEQFNTAINRSNREYAPCKLVVIDDPNNYSLEYYFAAIKIKGL